MVARVSNPNQQLILEEEGTNFRLRAASLQRETKYLAITTDGKVMLDSEKSNNTLFKFTETTLKDIQRPNRAEWEDEMVFGINKERGRAPSSPTPPPLSSKPMHATKKPGWILSKRNSSHSMDSGSSSMLQMLPSATQRL